MDIVVDLILSSAENPIEMAVYFMVFLAVLDALFSFIGTLFTGVISK